MSFDYNEIYNNIMELADDGYRSFHSSLVPGCNNIAGARIPALRALAKEIARGESWRELLSSPSRGLYEEEMLKGLVIGMAKCTPYERLELVKKFVPHIDNWAVCDTFVGGLKAFAKQQELIAPYIEECLKSDEEFTVRFAVCMLMKCFIDNEHIDFTLERISSVEHRGYYVIMGAAWALSECFIKQREKTLDLFQQRVLDRTVQNKAIQKCRESRRVSDKDKELLTEYKL